MQLLLQAVQGLPRGAESFRLALRFDVKRRSSMEVPAVLWLCECRRGNGRVECGGEKHGGRCAS